MEAETNRDGQRQGRMETETDRDGEAEKRWRQKQTETDRG